MEQEALARAANGIGTITLNRPRVINALTPAMIAIVAGALADWREDPAIRTVVLEGAGERGFCAGGDVRALRESIAREDPRANFAFFREEFALNAAIADYPKPIVALADGITMGGGIGLAGHAALRVVTERSRLAMPETRIGIVPDVGAMWLFAHCPGRFGEYLSLTGASMDAADAIAMGFADAFVPARRLDELVAALAARGGAESAERMVRSVAEDPGPGTLLEKAGWVDDAFSRESVTGILDRLREIGGEAAATAVRMEAFSPTALALALEHLRRSKRSRSLDEVLERDYAIGCWLTLRGDLAEGVRALLVDRDGSPRWEPSTLAEVPPSLVDEAFGFAPQPPYREG